MKQIKRANTDWWIRKQSMAGADGVTYIAYYYGVGEDGLVFEDFALTDTNHIYIARFDGACRVLESYASSD